MTQTRMRQIVIAVAALIVVALAGVGLAAALRAPDGSATSQGPSPDPVASQGPSSAPSNEADDDDDDSSSDGDGDGDANDDSSGKKFYGDTVIDSADGDAKAEFASGLSVRIVDVTPVELKGEGIGATSGPGFEVTIELLNNTGKKASLGSVVVNAYTGDERTPATPVENADGFEGSIAKGAKDRGTYTFGTSSNETLFIAVSTAADSGVVVLEHR